jgi:hypothetical protein
LCRETDLVFLAANAEALMDRFVARQNIEHYRDMLAKEPDEQRRAMIARLLAEEEARLAAANEAHKQDRGVKA